MCALVSKVSVKLHNASRIYAALSQYNEEHYPGGTNFEAIEQSLLDQLQYDTADTSHGLNLTLNQITGYYQGYDLAGYYRGLLEGNQDYLPSFLDHFDYSQGQRQDMQDIQKPAPAPEPETIDSVMNNGGSWNSDGQALRSDGTLCDDLPGRGDYEYSKTGRIDDYYPDGTAVIIIDGHSYPVWAAPKKQTSDNATSKTPSNSDSILSNPLTQNPAAVIGGAIIAAGIDLQNSTNPFGLSKGVGNAVFSNGRASVEALEANAKVFSGKSADEIAQMLRDAGYDVTIKESTRSRSGAQIIQINNPGNGKNITQVQISPGGGRHGDNPYVKISTNDQGIIKIVDGVESAYKTDGSETSTIIFTGGK